MATSSEFVTLCQAQVSLIASLGGSLSIVYLTEDWVKGERGKLIPIAAYPEMPVGWEEEPGRTRLPDTDDFGGPTQPILPAAPDSKIDPSPPPEVESFPEPEPETGWHPPNSHPESPRRQVLPLMHDRRVMGFLVTGRDDRPWNSQERRQLQAIAHTLTTACILERRSQWLREQFARQYQLQSREYETLHGLLHQLKSPFTALRTFGKLLLKRLLPDDRNRQLANNLLRESDRIQELLEQVDRSVERGEDVLGLPPLDIDISESPEASEPPQALLPATDIAEPLPVEAILDPLWTSACAIADDRQLTCISEIPAALPPVLGNAKALREALGNLLDNALKYTPPGGQIYLKVAVETPSRLGIAVSDTGPGVPPGDRDRLFERGYRGIQAEGDIPGTGLGLAIARDLLKETGGDIQAFSPAPPQWLPHAVSSQDGVGTTFVVWLPLAG
ncbi:MAG: sensor histidine kinase [Limnospira sp.]